MEKYVLPDLPYAYNALEPFYSAETLEIHHGKHHAGYVKNANDVMTRLVEARTTLKAYQNRALIGDLTFNVSGHVMHSLFWRNMTPDRQGGPSDALQRAIDNSLGGLDAFREQFFLAAKTLQGSGWVSLSVGPYANQLVVQQLHNHHQNLIPDSRCLLVLDMWEHAYYLQYMNRKLQWIEAFWELINWQEVSLRYAAVVGIADDN